MTFDTLIITMILIAVLSAVFFIVAIISDIIIPWLAPRNQATYIKKRI